MSVKMVCVCVKVSDCLMMMAVFRLLEGKVISFIVNEESEDFMTVKIDQLFASSIKFTNNVYKLLCI